MDSETKRKLPKPFSIESIIGTDRKSPEIDIENSISDLSRHSDEDERSDQMKFYFNGPFLPPNVNFPFLLGYQEPWLRMFGGQKERDDKRDSPVSVGSEESDGADDNTQGKLVQSFNSINRSW